MVAVLLELGLLPEGETIVADARLPEHPTAPQSSGSTWDILQKSSTCWPSLACRASRVPSGAVRRALKQLHGQDGLMSMSILVYWKSGSQRSVALAHLLQGTLSQDERCAASQESHISETVGLWRDRQFRV